MVEEKMDIRGGYAKPKITDILWIQLIFLPWTMCKWVYFYTRWFWKFGICKEEYGELKLHQMQEEKGGSMPCQGLTPITHLVQGEAGDNKPTWGDPM